MRWILAMMVVLMMVSGCTWFASTKIDPAESGVVHTDRHEIPPKVEHRRFKIKITRSRQESRHPTVQPLPLEDLEENYR